MVRISAQGLDTTPRLSSSSISPFRQEDSALKNSRLHLGLGGVHIHAGIIVDNQMEAEAFSREHLQSVEMRLNPDLASRNAQTAQSRALLVVLDGFSGCVGWLHNHKALFGNQVGASRHHDLCLGMMEEYGCLCLSSLPSKEQRRKRE